MNNLRFLSIVLLLGIFFCLNVSGQDKTADTLTIEPSAAYLISYFNKSSNEQSRLINGPVYDGYLKNIEGSAYFKDAIAPEKGTLIYDGFRYENIPMMYDMFKDVLVTVLPNGFSKYTLISERVSDFYLFGHHHVYIYVAEGDEKAVFKSGFFDLVYKGASEVLVKRSRNLEQSSSNTQITKYFRARTIYYFKKGDAYYRVNSESSFMDLYKDHKSELKKYLRTNKVKFRKDPEQALKLLASYCDSHSY